jgi:hypothetical protein
MLSIINKHDRDDYIQFQEEGHIYTLYDTQFIYKLFLLNCLHLCQDIIKFIYQLLPLIWNKRPISVTTLIHSLFPEFNANLIIKRMMKSPNWPQSQYYGKTPEQIYIKIIYIYKMLSIINKHYRDDYIKFQEEGHIYTLMPLDIFLKFFLIKQKYTNNGIIKLIIETYYLLTKTHPTSVTTLISTYHEKFDADKIINCMMKGKNWASSKYYGMTKKEIKDSWECNRHSAAFQGTNMHLCIENNLNGLNVHNDTPEYKYFQNFWRDFQSKYSQFKIYRTEHTIFDENFRNGKACCGSVDAILKDDDDNFIILDWKRSKEIKMKNSQKMLHPFNYLDDTNYNHYRLQLSIYSHILTTKYNYNIIYLMLVIFHPNNNDYVCIPVEKIDLTNIWNKL